MLLLDPEKRLSAEQCLQHPYFSAYHDPDDEPTAPLFEEGGELNECTIEIIKGIHTLQSPFSTLF